MTPTDQQYMDADIVERFAHLDPATDVELARWDTDAARRAVLDLIPAPLAPPAPPADEPLVAAIEPREPRRGRRRLVALAVAASVVATAITVAGIAGRPSGPDAPIAQRPVLGFTIGSASAADILRHAGDAARYAGDLKLTGDQRVYWASATSTLSSFTVQDANTPYRVDWKPTGESTELWIDADGNYLLHAGEPARFAPEALDTNDDLREHTTADDRVMGDPRFQPLSANYLSTVPTSRTDLSRWVDGRVAAWWPSIEEFMAQDTDASDGITTTGPDLTEKQWRAALRSWTIVSMLTEPLAPAELRGALFDLFATEPDVERAGTAKDALGRTGQLLVYPAYTTDDERAEVLIDPASGTVLETRLRRTALSIREELKPVIPGPPADIDVPAAALVDTTTYLGPVVVGNEKDLPPGPVADEWRQIRDSVKRVPEVVGTAPQTIGPDLPYVSPT